MYYVWDLENNRNCITRLFYQNFKCNSSDSVKIIYIKVLYINIQHRHNPHKEKTCIKIMQACLSVLITLMICNPK